MIIKWGGSWIRPARGPKTANNVTQHGRLVAGNCLPVFLAFTIPNINPAGLVISGESLPDCQNSTKLRTKTDALGY